MVLKNNLSNNFNKNIDNVNTIVLSLARTNQKLHIVEIQCKLNRFAIQENDSQYFHSRNSFL